jgi:raffinose/stachyose/melibiose transport system permease protein
VFMFCKRWIKLILLLPSLLFFSVYTFYPIVYSLLIAFQHKPSFQTGRFIGLANFAAMAKDAHLSIAFTNTLIMTVLELLLILPLSFLLGMFINRDFKGSGIVKLICFTPYILSPIITSLVWFFIVDPGIGLLNGVLKANHLNSLALQWIGGRKLTPYTVAVIESWKALGFYSVLFMAGLKMIPRELYEAATIDGASSRQKTIYLTIPMLKETLKIVTVYIFINAIQSLQTITVLTNGGPNYASHNIATYMYFEFLWDRKAGYASAMALLMFIAMMVISVGFLKFTAKRVED